MHGYQSILVDRENSEAVLEILCLLCPKNKTEIEEGCYVRDNENVRCQNELREPRVAGN